MGADRRLIFGTALVAAATVAVWGVVIQERPVE
jgi:hypothetical protein